MPNNNTSDTPVSITLSMPITERDCCFTDSIDITHNFVTYDDIKDFLTEEEIKKEYALKTSVSSSLSKQKKRFYTKMEELINLLIKFDKATKLADRVNKKSRWKAGIK